MCAKRFSCWAATRRCLFFPLRLERGTGDELVSSFFFFSLSGLENNLIRVEVVVATKVDVFLVCTTKVEDFFRFDLDRCAWLAG